ncbi:MAG: hypothetical protein CBE32_001040 [Candidatus Pelagibacter sp. TMED272]|nr:hypothetical protein [Pelagibacteraceae bacterium]RPG93575.1 MAG: hypothetical protein CBE32_001040 [Candidatus Pelagibacter sp. TMED272]|tara:strand:+ start:3206 stop:3826 length:621 start_codon:yes stop_codon:yes gene_type:complete
MKKKFPNLIPVFPLSGVIYFPNTNLPLNVFEQRYLDLVNDIMQKDKLMGMIQANTKGKEVFNVGCLGKISDFQKSEDGRILINLTGLIRFEVLEEVENSKLYREFKVDYKKFDQDLEPALDDINIEELMKTIKVFFTKNGLVLNWKEFDKLDKIQKINTLAMIAPIGNGEKQKLLESISIKEKVKNLQDIVNFYLHETEFNIRTIQ